MQLMCPQSGASDMNYKKHLVPCSEFNFIGLGLELRLGLAEVCCLCFNSKGQSRVWVLFYTKSSFPPYVLSWFNFPPCDFSQFLLTSWVSPLSCSLPWCTNECLCILSCFNTVHRHVSCPSLWLYRCHVLCHSHSPVFFCVTYWLRTLCSGPSSDFGFWILSLPGVLWLHHGLTNVFFFLPALDTWVSLHPIKNIALHQLCLSFLHLVPKH